MPANTRAVKRRIRSVASTQQITRAMKMVAAAKLRRAQERLFAMRPYADALEGLLGRLLPYAFGDEHPLLMTRPVKKVAVLFVTSDKGLCGGFNANLFRRLNGFLQEKSGVDTGLVTVGRKGEQYFAKRGAEIIKAYRDIYDDLDYTHADIVSEDLVERYLGGEFDELYILYSRFVSAITQKQEVTKLLPFDADRYLTPDTSVFEGVAAGEKPAWSDEIVLPDIIVEPDLDATLTGLIQRVQTTEIFRYLLESISSEHAARMTAMEAATSNAGDMIDRLTLQLNRARQAAITTELTEIVAGADAIQQ